MFRLQEAGCRARYLIRDRDGKLPRLMDEILAEAGIRTVYRSNIELRGLSCGQAAWRYSLIMLATTGIR